MPHPVNGIVIKHQPEWSYILGKTTIARLPSLSEC